MILCNISASYASYLDETDRLIIKVLENTTEKSVSFGFITDLHYDDVGESSKNSIKSQLNALVQNANRGGLDFIALDGDLYSGFELKNSK